MYAHQNTRLINGAGCATTTTASHNSWVIQVVREDGGREVLTKQSTNKTKLSSDKRYHSNTTSCTYVACLIQEYSMKPKGEMRCSQRSRQAANTTAPLTQVVFSLFLSRLPLPHPLVELAHVESVTRPLLAQPYRNHNAKAHERAREGGRG